MIPDTASAPASPRAQRFLQVVRHPVRWLDDLCGDGPLYALLVLFGLNMVDDLNRSAFGVLAPNIADHFDTGITGIFTVLSVAAVAAMGLTMPMAWFADRYSRVFLAVLGGAAMATFSIGTGLSVSVLMLGAMLAAGGLGTSVITPAHGPLLADYYPIELRPRIYAFHRAANSLGQLVGPATAGFIAFYLGWRAPFILFAIPTFILVLLGFRMREPVRGWRERQAMGADEDATMTEEEPPSFAEAWRMCWKIDSLRRIYRTLPFLVPAIFGFVTLAAFLYSDIFGLDERERGIITSIAEPAQIIGLIVGARLGLKMFARDPKLVFKALSVGSLLVAASTTVFALSPEAFLTVFGIRIPVVAVAAHMASVACLALLLPGTLAALALTIPPRARAMGFSMAWVFAIPGLAILPLMGWVGETWGVRQGMLTMVPMFVIGSFVIGSAGHFIARDIANVWTTSAARSKVVFERSQGRSKLLLVSELDVSYGDVQVLFGVDFEVDEGEVVALLGTNGAGKSTLLKAISGVVEAGKGAVIFDGRDITHAPPNEITPRGIVQVPGGQGVFGSLTVAENLRFAAWTRREPGWARRRDHQGIADATEQVYQQFPVLRQRAAEPAANLSGGQQQMLALGMALMSKPRLLMIDELSLGLAPVVVEQLVGMVRRLRDEGITIILVEQSVNVALTLADEAYFMEKGEIRFHGPTAELLDRPDVLRSVFLEGAASGLQRTAVSSPAPGSTAPPAVSGEPDASDGPGGSASPDVTARHGSTAARPQALAQAQANGVAALELYGVTRSFGGIRAVDQVTLTVAPGEVVGIIGPNGSGKTTLFDVVSGYTPADSGGVRLLGRDITRLPPHARALRGLGRSFQDPRLFANLSVEETIKVALDRWTRVRSPLPAAFRLPAAFDSEEDVQRRTDELIELLGLQAFRSKFVGELSTGSRRIVDLACIVAMRPSVVLLDEPSSGIAQREAEALGPVILRIRDELGASILVIEHDMPLATTVSDRLVALEVGRVIAEGDPQEVLHHSEVVASYLGTSGEVVARSGANAGQQVGES